MTSTSINISGKLDEAAIKLYIKVNQVAGRLSIPFVVVGASARDIIMHHAYGANIQRATMDIDIGIQVTDWKAFFEMTSGLIKAGFTETSIQHRLRSPLQMEVDIVPFGRVQDAEADLKWPPDGDVVMNVLGFQEAFDNAVVVRIQDLPPVDIPVATPIGIALLKIIAWTDRKSKKDVKDLFYLLSQSDKIPAIRDSMYRDEEPMIKYDWDSTLAGAYLLGKEVNKISSSKTKEVIQNLIDGKIDGLNKDFLVEDMCDNIEHEFERKVPLVEAFITGFTS
ncbi:MAG: nucleotidyl transferase AbiEii/AbiGii toxin family protein [Candidatus Glassbacteria bacterium]